MLQGPCSGRSGGSSWYVVVLVLHGTSNGLLQAGSASSYVPVDMSRLDMQKCGYKSGTSLGNIMYNSDHIPITVELTTLCYFILFLSFWFNEPIIINFSLEINVKIYQLFSLMFWTSLDKWRCNKDIKM